jgi:predicted aspartyl protease
LATLPIVECGFLGLPGTPRDALVASGPAIIVDIGFDPAILVQVAAGGPVQPMPPPGVLNVNRVLALIDTGATQSCIDEALAQQLQLPLVNQQNAAGVGGVHVLNVYLAYIALPLLGHLQAGLFIGAQLSAGGMPHRALIGRTLLADTLMVYDGRTGSVKLAL